MGVKDQSIDSRSMLSRAARPRNGRDTPRLRSRARGRAPVIAHFRDMRWNLVVQGMTAGLYLSRVIAESSIGPWRPIQLLALFAGSASLSLAFLALLRKSSAQTWPLYLLLGYVLWPHVSPALSFTLLFIVLAMVWILNVPDLACNRWLPTVLFLVMLALYVNTLAPTVLPADSGEFQLVSNVLGIAHPPGYPLYTLLGKLFTLFPIGDGAYRVNLFGAVCGALTVAVVARSVWRSTDSAAASLLAAGALGLSATFWAQSTVANIRSLTALLTAVCLALLLRWGESRSRRYLVAFGACFGLGLGHHLSIGLLGLPFLAYILTQSPRIILKPREWAPPVAAFAASLLVLLYLPIRSMTGIPAISSWAGFVDYVFALGFRGDVLYFRSVAELAARIPLWLNIMRLQFGPVLPWATLLAAPSLGRRDWRALLLLSGAWAVNTLSAITYRAPQTVEYLMPSYVALALLLGHGLGLALRFRLSRPAGAALAAALLLCAVSNGMTNYSSFAELHRDTSARDYAQAILEDAPQGALVLSNWHHATTFWYLQQVEGLRPDVEVTYVYPEGSLPNEEVWLRRIGEQLAHRPVVVTNLFHAFAHTDYRWIPFHGAWLVRQEPPTDLPERMVGGDARFEDGIHVLGYELEKNDLVPGDTVRLHVYWQPTRQLQNDYSTFVQVIGSAGVVGQDDIVHRSSGYRPGEIRVDLYSFPLLLHTPPGEYRVVTGFYLAGDGGWKRLLVGESDHLNLTSIRVNPGREPVATLHPMSHHFANGLRLTGLDYDRSISGQTRLYLHWRRADAALVEMGPWKPRFAGPTLVRLTSDGSLVAQGSLSNLEAGSSAMLALDVPDGLEEVSLGIVGPDGQPVARLGPWHLRVGADLKPSLPEKRARYIPLGREMAFVGFSRLPEMTKPGQEVWLRPRFLSLRPLTADYSVSVGLVSLHAASRPRRDLGWEQKADGTPALGAIPTLKWLRGWLVDDPHRLTLADSAPVGPAAATLAVYDAFTLEPLHVLDERLVREGMGVHLELDPILVE